ncbi:MAG: transposase [Rhodospirillales bacterium]|nr:transposase [Rhodospirillales bacterium]
MHAVCDGEGRPLMLLLTEGQMSDHRGAAMMLHALPPARELLADRGYDRKRFRAAFIERDLAPCIP